MERVPDVFVSRQRYRGQRVRKCGDKRQWTAHYLSPREMVGGFFLMWGGGGRLSHCFQGNGGYKSSLTEVKGEAIDRKLTANEEGSQQIKTTS